MELSAREVWSRSVVMMVLDGFPAPAPMNFEIAFLFHQCVLSECSPLTFIPPCSWLLELTSKSEEPTQSNDHMLHLSESAFAFLLNSSIWQIQGYNTILLWLGQKSLCTMFYQQEGTIFLFMWYLVLLVIFTKNTFCIDIFVASKGFGLSRLWQQTGESYQKRFSIVLQYPSLLYGVCELLSKRQLQAVR